MTTYPPNPLGLPASTANAVRKVGAGKNRVTSRKRGVI